MTITLELDAKELEQRKKEWKRPQKQILTGLLTKYQKLVSSASTGALTN